MHFPGVSRGRWRHRVHRHENFHGKMQGFHTAELTVDIHIAKTTVNVGHIVDPQNLVKCGIHMCHIDANGYSEASLDVEGI